MSKSLLADKLRKNQKRLTKQFLIIAGAILGQEWSLPVFIYLNVDSEGAILASTSSDEYPSYFLCTLDAFDGALVQAFEHNVLTEDELNEFREIVNEIPIAFEIPDDFEFSTSNK